MALAHERQTSQKRLKDGVPNGTPAILNPVKFRLVG
jgi:hypothetical protein